MDLEERRIFSSSRVTALVKVFASGIDGAFTHSWNFGAGSRVGTFCCFSKNIGVPTL